VCLRVGNARFGRSVVSTSVRSSDSLTWFGLGSVCLVDLFACLFASLPAAAG
jgi:hypothetical protein